MAKKLSASFLREKPIKKKKRSILNTIKKSKDSIDYSAIPEINFTQLGKTLVARFYKPTKKITNIIYIV